MKPALFMVAVGVLLVGFTAHDLYIGGVPAYLVPVQWVSFLTASGILAFGLAALRWFR